MTLGEAMKKARIKHGISVAELAEKTGVTESSIRNWEEDRNVPNVLFVETMADVMGMSIDEYIDHKVRRNTGK